MQRQALATAAYLATTLLLGASAGADTRSRGAPAPAATCPPLKLEPAPARVATGGAIQIHALGGTGAAIFRLEGDGRGARIEPGGGLRAGDRAASFTVVARDACGAEARAPAEVIGPFAVRPEAIGLPRGGSLTFEATGALGDVTYRLLDRPSGKGAPGDVDARGAFRAGDIEGVYQLVARDAGSGREVRLTVDVGKPVPLRPRAPLVAVPAGGRVRLGWRGGSGSVFAASAPEGSVIADGDALFFDARRASPPFADVTVRDRFTRETASVRVLIGETIGAPPVARGTQSQLGDLASGDVNGDGRDDLVIGHAERSRTEAEAGGILVAYGKEGGGLAAPIIVVEGRHGLDHEGSTLLVTDINGDGIDDVISGAPEENLGGSDRGTVSIYLGGKGGLSADPDRVLAGEGNFHRFGAAVAVADLNGDGAPDLVTSAPGAKSPFAPTCEGGRVYVFTNLGRQRGAIAAIPAQVIDLRAPLSDDPLAPVPCSPTLLGAGRALALLDMDGDKVLDLVVGAPMTSFPVANRAQGSVLVYRGTKEGKFEPSPSFAIHLEPSIRADGANFGAALDVVRAAPAGPAVLVVRAPFFNPRGPNGALMSEAGGLWTFPPGSLGPPPPARPGSPPEVRVVTTSRARAHLWGAAANRGFGRSAVMADVDPLPGSEYVVSSVAPGSLSIFGAAQIATATGTLTPIAEVPVGALGELAGARVAALRSNRPKADALAGLAIWAPWRSTQVGPFAGAIDWIAQGRGPLATRLQTPATFALPNFGAGDRAGSAVALGALEKKGDAPDAIVGAPFAHSPARPGHPEGEQLRTGSVDVFRADPGAPIARAWVDRRDAQLGGGPLVTLDFDGDGAMDVAVGDSIETAGGPAPAGFVDPDGCNTLDSKGALKAVGARGVVRIYSLVGGALVERFRVTAPREAAHDDGGPRYLQNRTGAVIAKADVNGDGMDDLLVGRLGYRDSSGAEVVLGRKPDASGKVLIACNTGAAGPTGALALPPGTAANPVNYGLAVAGLGDLDRDGCDEVALSIRHASYPGPARAGVLVAFGHDASGARCKGHKAPFLLHVVPDDRPLADNKAGDAAKRADDTVDRKAAPTGMGAALARGSGDVTGDGVPDLVFRDADLTYGDLRGPAVEIISGAYLAGLCPNHVCPEGRAGPLWSDKDWHVVALRALGAPERRALPSDGLARSFGAALAIGDLTGDGVAELAIGSSDASGEGSFTGEVRVLRGGPSLQGGAEALADPLLLAVGDVTERGAFGASIAIERGGGSAWMLVGAPQSSRRHTGGAVGAAYRFRVEVPR